VTTEIMKRQSFKYLMHQELPNYMLVKPATEQSAKPIKRAPLSKAYNKDENTNNIKVALLRGKNYVERRQFD